jgi:hypothetical protein
MLRLAKRMLRQVLDALRPALRAGLPVVGLEPSCISVFRDELVNLFPDDDDAKRLSASRPVCWRICSLQLNPSAITIVSSAARRMAGTRRRSAHAIETSWCSRS